jgi:hypothetical protein
MNSRRPLVGIVLGGLVLGLGLGLLYAWVIRPVNYVDTAPFALRADFKDQFRGMIASAYAANGDLLRARARLALLGDAAPAAALMDQSRRAAGPGGSAESAQALANLAEALSPTAGASPSVTVISETATSTVTPAATKSPNAGSPPARPARTTTASPSPTATRTPRPTLTLRPSATATVTPGRPFAIVSNDTVCDENLQPGLLQVVILDADGKQVAGSEIVISWQGGQESFFTGLKPELGDGYADYLMQAGIAYSLRLEVDSEAAEGLSILPCRTAGGSSFDGGIKLVFQQP